MATTNVKSFDICAGDSAIELRSELRTIELNVYKHMILNYNVCWI